MEILKSRDGVTVDSSEFSRRESLWIYLLGLILYLQS